MRQHGHRFPDFIIAGAPRSGTTWLWQLADRHPEIAMAQPALPEPKFFNVDDLYERGMDYYAARWFDPLPETAVCGEKSANYLERSTVAERIHAHLPAVKLVFALRNPVDRAFSNFLWSTQNGHEHEPSFARAMELEAEREARYPPDLRFARPYSYFSRGLYAQLLAPYLALFARDQVLVLRTEDVAAQPDDVARRVFAFLGVDSTAVRAADVGIVNAVERHATLAADVRAHLAHRYQDANQSLAAMLGSDFVLWEN